MGMLLYTYNTKSLQEFRRAKQEYRFYSISYFLQYYDDLHKLKDLDSNILKDCIIDLSNLFRNNGYYHIFVERYILCLSEKHENLSFCLNADLLNVLLEYYPFIFSEENIKHDYEVSSEGLSNTASYHQDKSLKILSPTILFYYDPLTIQKESKEEIKIIPLSNLLSGATGFLNYDISSIDRFLSENHDQIEYIDISSAIHSINLRSDFILQIEILFSHILTEHSVKLCVETDLVDNALDYFPFIFLPRIDSRKITLPQSETDDECTNGCTIESNIHSSEILEAADRICLTLKGHDAFKDDFKRNLLKFNFLNRINERKLLSIMICGDSGIGKTQFAKIVSQILYPEEQLIKINFGNYSTEGVLNSLIGSPLGYVGSEEGGELINKISRSKSKVILIDEFEKATPSVFNFFYELLEDGVFTDRHGTQHDLNGYIIVFTSNMTQTQYEKNIPNPLKSRFDMVYYFVDLPVSDKHTYILETADKLNKRLKDEFGTEIDLEKINTELHSLSQYSNLRSIKRRVEDIVFKEFFIAYSLTQSSKLHNDIQEGMCDISHVNTRPFAEAMSDVKVKRSK